MNDDLRTAEQDAAVAHIRDPLEAHFREAEDTTDEDGKFCIGFRATFDRGASPTKVKVVSRITKALTDEIESTVEDPQQPALL
jgi:hypothetical protein